MASDKKDKAVVTVDPTPMQLISQVVENPDFDVAKLEKMMDLQERWEDRQAERQFNEAVTQFQRECPNIVRSRKGAHDIKYAPLDEIMRTIQPVLTEHGLAVRFSTRWDHQGYITAVCTVSHEAGHSEESEITIPVDDKMSANSSQKMGSANSYAKRYALSNALNLAFAEDDTDAANLAEKITEDQAVVINDLLDELNLPAQRRNAFLKWAKAKSVEDIPRSFFKDAERYLTEIRDGNS